MANDDYAPAKSVEENKVDKKTYEPPSWTSEKVFERAAALTCSLAAAPACGIPT